MAKEIGLNVTGKNVTPSNRPYKKKTSRAKYKTRNYRFGRPNKHDKHTLDIIAADEVQRGVECRNSIAQGIGIRTIHQK